MEECWQEVVAQNPFLVLTYQRSLRRQAKTAGVSNVKQLPPSSSIASPPRILQDVSQLRHELLAVNGCARLGYKRHGRLGRVRYIYSEPSPSNLLGIRGEREIVLTYTAMAISTQILET